MRTPKKKAPEAAAAARGAEEYNNTASPKYSATLDDPAAVVCFDPGTYLMPVESAWRAELAQGSRRFRNQEHQTYVNANSRTGRRKLARMARKKGRVKP